MCLQTSSLRKYTIDDFLPTWLNIFQDVTRSAWENEWKTAGDSSVPCCGCFLTLLVKSNDSISFLQSQTQVTYSVNFYFSQHTRETCTVREIAYCLREKVIAFAGRQQCTCYMLKQNCHFHCKYAFMWSGVYQHLNWELEMWRLLLCVTHFCSFFTKKNEIHICMCFCVMFFVWKLACYLEQKKKVLWLWTRCVAFRKPKRSLSNNYLWNTEVSMNDMLINMLQLSFTHALTLQWKCAHV